MSASGNERPIDLRFVRTVLQRRRRLLVVATLVGAAVGVTVALLLPRSYSGLSLVLLGSPSEAQSLGSGALSLDVETSAQLALSDAVLSEALRESGSGLTVDDLRGRMSVSTPTDSLLQVVVSDQDAARASDLAQAVAEAHVGYVERVSAPAADEALRVLRSRIADLEAQADQLNEEISSARDRQSAADQAAVSSQEAELIGALSAQRAQVSVLLSQLEAQVEAATKSGRDTVGLSARVLDDPGIATAPDVARAAVAAGAAGAIVGLLVALALALRTAVRDPAIWSTEQVRRVLGTPVVAGIGSRPQRDPEGWRRLLADYEAPPVDAWAVRRTLRWLAATSRVVETEAAPPGRHRRGSASGSPSTTPASPDRVTLIVLANDPRGQSLAAILAATSAALGTPVALCSMDNDPSGVTLQAGLALFRREEDPSSPLAVVAWPEEVGADRTVLMLSVFDERAGLRSDLPATGATLLCLGPGVTTVEGLSKLALATDSQGHHIDGVLVSDPSGWDQPEGVVAAPLSTPEQQIDEPDGRASHPPPRRLIPRSGA